MKTLIQHADVLCDPASGKICRLDVLMDENEILDVRPDIDADALSGIYPDEEIEVTEASGLTLIPGLVDTHVHLRDPGYTDKETIATGTRAAAHGGFTTIFAMPNVSPFPSSPEVIRNYLDHIEKQAVVRVHPFATITENEAGAEPVDYAAIKALGIPWFSDDGVGVQSAQVMERCMKQAKEADVLFSCHTEDMNWRRPLACVHESAVFDETGYVGIPSACESDQLIRDLQMARPIGLRYHADHISAKESVEALARAKAQGQPVSAEVTAHHLLLEDQDVRGPNWKMNPPLRSHADRIALIEGLESGALDWIANDHAPHTRKEKLRPMDKAPFGITALETSFPLLYTEFVSRKKRWSLGQLVNWMSLAPALGMGLEKTGKIEPGYHPDVVLLDLHAKDVIDPDTFCSKAANTPFAGWQSDCKVVCTWCKGKKVWKE